jgi:putative aldouronate transport system substrate-binding protein
MLIIAISFCLFAGAPNESEEGITNYSIFYGHPGTQPTADNKILKLIKEEFGVTFTQEFTVGEVAQKIGVITASGDYPDIVQCGDYVKGLIEADVLIPLEDLIMEHAPNIYEHYKPFWNQIKDPDDGHIYVLASYGRVYGKYMSSRSFGPAFNIQRGVLKEFGYPEIKTLDEYFDIIEKYKAKYPEVDGKKTIGFEILSYSWRAFCLKNPPQHLAGYPNDGEVIVDPKTSVGEIFADKEIAKKYYKKLNEAYLKGLIEKETFVQNYDQYLANISSGRVLGMFDQYWQFQNADENLKTQGEYNKMYVQLPLVYEGVKDYYMDRPPLNINRGFGITTACKDPVKFLKLLDTLLEEKWSKIMNWGIEGEDYLVRENGKMYMTPEMRDNFSDPTWKTSNRAQNFWGEAPKREGLYSDGNGCTPGEQPEEFLDGLKPEEKEYLDAYGYKTYIDVFSPPPPNRVDYPAWQIALPDGSPAAVVAKKMDDLKMKWLPKVITAPAGEFDALWTEYVTEFRKLPTDDFLTFINDGLKFRVENWGTK